MISKTFEMPEIVLLSSGSSLSSTFLLSTVAGKMSEKIRSLMLEVDLGFAR